MVAKIPKCLVIVCIFTLHVHFISALNTTEEPISIWSITSRNKNSEISLPYSETNSNSRGPVSGNTENNALHSSKESQGKSSTDSKDKTSTDSNEKSSADSEEKSPVDSKGKSTADSKEKTSGDFKETSSPDSKDTPSTVSKESSSSDSKEKSSTDSEEISSIDSKEKSSTDSEETSSTDSIETSSTDSEETSSTDSKEKSSTDSEETSSTDSKEKSSTDSEETSSTDSKEKSSTDSEETSSIDSIEKSSTDSKETSSTDSKEKSSTDSEETSSTDSIEKSSIDSKETSSTDSKEKSSTDSEETSSTDSKDPLSTDSIEKSSTDSKDPLLTDSIKKSSTDLKENSPVDSKEKPPAGSKEKSNVDSKTLSESEKIQYFHSAEKRSSDSDEMSSSTSVDWSIQSSTTFSTVSADVCTSREPIYIWPLGEEIGITNIKTNQSDGTIRTITYMTSPNSVGGYNTTHFGGFKDSFVEVKFPYYTPLDKNDDYVILFYVYFDNVTSGTILDFKSLTDTKKEEKEIRKFMLYLKNGNLEMDTRDYGTHYFNTSLQPQTWYHVAIQRDRSKNYFTIYINGNKWEGLNISLSEKITLLPGKFRLGSDFHGKKNLQGAIACLQWIPCKDSVDPVYDSQCEESNWQVSTNVVIDTMSSTLSSTQSSLSPTIKTSEPKREKQLHFKRVDVNVTFNSELDIIAVVKVQSVIQCTKLCLVNTRCAVFVVENLEPPFICKLGDKMSGMLDSDTDTAVFIAL